MNASNVYLNNVVISGGSGAKSNKFEITGQINFHNVDNLIIDGLIASNNVICDDNVHLAYVRNFLIKNSLFENSLSDAVDVDISNGKFQSVRINASGNDGVDLMDSRVSMSEMNVTNSGDKGISVGEGSSLNLLNSNLRANNKGIEVKDGSMAKIEQGVVFNGNKLDVNLYKKNWRYGRGGQIFISKNSEVTLKSDLHSKVVYE
jgi:hypothetical protein